MKLYHNHTPKVFNTNTNHAAQYASTFIAVSIKSQFYTRHGKYICSFGLIHNQLGFHLKYASFIYYSKSLIATEEQHHAIEFSTKKLRIFHIYIKFNFQLKLKNKSKQKSRFNYLLSIKKMNRFKRIASSYLKRISREVSVYVLKSLSFKIRKICFLIRFFDT